jgi:ribonuclease T2
MRDTDMNVKRAIIGLFAVALAMAVSGQSARAQDRAGVFDYYILVLSWTPSWCEFEGDSRGDARCDSGERNGWKVHGLWPQFDDGGWPEYCQAVNPAPSRIQTAAMADIMGASGLAWHQWNKHGSCSGLTSRAYYQHIRDALNVAEVPDLFSRIDRELTVSPDVIEAAFLEVNPEMGPDMMAVTCLSGDIQEIRICLSTDLEPRECGLDVLRQACRSRSADLPPLR